MMRVLIVDDFVVDRLAMGGLFEDDGEIEVEYADSGAAALERVQERAPDVIVTDLSMPEMDGLQLVRALREDDSQIPVVLVTSKGSERTAVEALHAGATSYVPKRLLAQYLRETVDDVLASLKTRTDQRRLMSRLTRSNAHFELCNDRSQFPPLIEYVQNGVASIGFDDETQRTQFGVALEEALVNAAEHGNLELDSQLKSDDRDSYFKLLEVRLQERPYRDRLIRVAVDLSRGEVRITIEDEGQGFDVSSLPDPRDPANLLKPSGRGVFLMRTFMDEVNYNDPGNQVTLVKRWSVD